MPTRLRLAVMLAALWWAGLGTIAVVVVPMLFMHLPSAALAGAMGARLFSVQSYMALGLGLALLWILKPEPAEKPVEWARGTIVLIVSGMLLALLLEHAVAPRILARHKLMVWHSVGSGLMLLQWIASGALVWRLLGADQRPRDSGG